ncbi:cytochrome d ubiquinol oxidase subunit II [Pseudomaricurvus sp. HS19]|uniref:cytochrome d ubiquinol oxidase subunit II n=1 Tax=Pseudomaricurvus sp. HS19 TaxID=2692626 RepID=UPI00136A08E3|nr:cytochrome d ubiquinol oxidase subunit II [Pseudomaricurvus sp. HS19]MYM63296.1 cytochrome d ubiquinol oxidase subunit II [Pseudomaricurvus sp. HS19]
MLDYESLKLIWWLLIGVLLVGFAITDGFDMGVAMLLKIVGKDDVQRRVLINTIAPHWDGNQVWFITAGGAIFAAWPLVYATAFSGLYAALMITLMAMFLRPVGFDYRSKIDNPTWRSRWDWGLTIGSFVPALIFGVAFGNLLQGVPFSFDDVMRSHYHGSFWQLLNPFALLCGLLSVAMFVTQGASWLMLKTRNDILQRSSQAALISALLVVVMFGVAGLFLNMGMQGYRVVTTPEVGGVVTPVMKTVLQDNGGWQANFNTLPLLWLLPIAGLLSGMLVVLSAARRWCGLAFFASSVMQGAIIGTAGVAMFPFVMPSNFDPNHSLTLFDAVSSRLTLNIMFWVAMVFVPIVLGYTLWSYIKMAGRLDEETIHGNPHGLY